MKLPTYFISHGGGPWPYIPDMQASNATLAASLADIPKQIGAKPKAILMVSAHWETPGTFMVMSTPKPPMVYDYYGFPAHTYEIQYPAPGAPALARSDEHTSALQSLMRIPYPVFCLKKKTNEH